MSKYWNERTRSLEPYVPGEQPRDRKVIKLNTNENPYPPSPQVLEAIRKAAGEGLRLYPDPASRDLREAVAEKYGVRPEQVFAGNGSDEVLAFAFAAFFPTKGAAEGGFMGTDDIPKTDASPQEPSPVLFPDITYSFYPVYAGLWGASFETIPLAEDFSIHLDEYLRPSGGVVLANPNAPTGMALSAEAFRPLAAFLERRGRVLLVDEAYAPFAGQGTSTVPLIKEYPNLLTVHTLSKAASLAGLRVGFAVGDEALIEGLCRVRDSFNSYPLDALAQAGAAAAIRDRAYYAGINQKVTDTRDRVSTALREMGFTVLPSEANFIFISPPGGDGEGLFAALRERGILTRRFNKPRIAEFLRVSIGAGEEMDTFLEQCRVEARRVSGRRTFSNGAD